MRANPILLQKKYARIVYKFSKKENISLNEGLNFFYNSFSYILISRGISDMHCMSDDYLAEELVLEYEGKNILYNS